jgi:hypothetical protein
MCPKVSLADGRGLGSIVTVLVKGDPAHETAQFQYIVKQTHAPVERYEAAVRILQNVYYQYPGEFSDELTALFKPSSSIVRELVAAGCCTLSYYQANQHFSIPCAVHKLAETDPFFQATYWHNAMFNSKSGGSAQVLKFVADWDATLAEPQQTLEQGV